MSPACSVFSGTSSDVRDLLAREKRDRRGGGSRGLVFVSAKKNGSALCRRAPGDWTTLVFAGRHRRELAVIRARICKGLGFLGLTLGPARNARKRAPDFDRHQPGQVRGSFAPTRN